MTNPETSSDLVPVATMHKSATETIFSKGWVPNLLGFSSSPLYDATTTAERDEDKAHIAKLQAALMFWMPGVSEAIEVELNGRAGDDAYLLAGYAGEFPATCWGDDILARLAAAESLAARQAEALKEALHWITNIDNSAPVVRTIRALATESSNG